jgi:hypothetical protein
MNPFRRIQDYFVGSVLARTDDVFEQVKAEVLVNFTIFFFVTNLPYLFIATDHAIHMAMGISVQVALAAVLIILRTRSNVGMATFFFLLNFLIQMGGHFVINNGLLEAQGVLFSLLFALSGFLLLDRKWGSIISLAMAAMYIVGTYNILHHNSLWSCDPEIADPTEQDALKYLALIPFALNVYLISEFVKARQKAEKQLAERKRMIEEKQKEILDSIHYAKRIQKSLMTHESTIEKNLKRLQAK